MSKKLCCLLPILVIGISAALFFFLKIDDDKKLDSYCAFCDPAVLNYQKFYEDDLVLALYTHKPIFPGHSLVIPKRHVERFEMLSEEEIAQIGRVIKKVNYAASKVFGTTAYLLLQKNAAEVGQTVPHVHFHYIPRKKGDNSTLKFLLRAFIANLQGPIGPAQMQDAVEKMREEMELTPIPADNYKILVLWTGAGEREWANRLERVCSRMNIECKTAFCPNELSNLEQSLLGDCVLPQPLDQIVDEVQPDFAISLSKRCQPISSNIKKYLAISGDSKKIFDVTCPHPEEFLEYDGLLYASPQIDKIKEFIDSSGDSFRGIDWYPSCPATQFEPIIPKRLFYCGFQWDRKRNGAEYQKMFSLLDKTGYLDIYGPPERWECTPNSRKGCLPFDGKSLTAAIRECGIALLLHADSHLDLEAPTGRIFEAASASSVIISDQNPFIMKEFGSSVPYIDGTLSGEDLFQQIDDHMKWIYSHPEEAQKMAQKAHAIFLEKFTLERQMLNLIRLHEEIIEQG